MRNERVDVDAGKVDAGEGVVVFEWNVSDNSCRFGGKLVCVSPQKMSPIPYLGLAAREPYVVTTLCIMYGRHEIHV
jgi:hypothetical protein